MGPLMLVLLCTAAPAVPRPPAFELVALGVLGGDTDTNLSSVLLGLPGKPAELMIDGGSVMPGLQRALEKRGLLARDATPSAQIREALTMLKPLRAFLLTHAHLDHWVGFGVTTTLHLGLALQGKAPLPIVGLPPTLDALSAHVFHAPLWADFTAAPKASPALALAPLPPGKAMTIGPFTVETVELEHTVPSAAFLIHSGEAAYLHLGDTGPTTRVWEVARPLLASGALRAVALELSFPEAQQPLALTSRHLTRNLYLLELAKLAGLPAPLPPPSMDPAQAVALARTLAPHFRACPVLVIHIKAQGYDQVRAELAPLQAAGLNLIVPEQGETYRF